MAVFSTGAGKSLTAVAASAKCLAGTVDRVHVITMLSILRQFEAEFALLWPEGKCRVTVSTVQGFLRNAAYVGKRALLVVDEAHALWNPRGRQAARAGGRLRPRPAAHRHAVRQRPAAHGRDARAADGGRRPGPGRGTLDRARRATRLPRPGRHAHGGQGRRPALPAHGVAGRGAGQAAEAGAEAGRQLAE